MSTKKLGKQSRRLRLIAWMPQLQPAACNGNQRFLRKTRATSPGPRWTFLILQRHFHWPCSKSTYDFEEARALDRDGMLQPIEPHVRRPGRRQLTAYIHQHGGNLKSSQLDGASGHSSAEVGLQRCSCWSQPSGPACFGRLDMEDRETPIKPLLTGRWAAISDLAPNLAGQLCHLILVDKPVTGVGEHRCQQGQHLRFWGTQRGCIRIERSSHFSPAAGRPCHCTSRKIKFAKGRNGQWHRVSNRGRMCIRRHSRKSNPANRKPNAKFGFQSPPNRTKRLLHVELSYGIKLCRIRRTRLCSTQIAGTHRIHLIGSETSLSRLYGPDQVRVTPSQQHFPEPKLFALRGPGHPPTPMHRRQVKQAQSGFAILARHPAWLVQS